MIPSQTYAAAGVNIAAARRAKDLMAAAVRTTYGPEVLAGHGAFGGLYDAAGLKALASPVALTARTRPPAVTTRPSWQAVPA